MTNQFQFNQNPLANIYYGGNMKTAHSTPAIIGGPTETDTETLPYGGGTYNPSGDAEITPAPIFTGAPVAPATVTPPAEEATPANDLYAKYRDPKTGEVMTPQEYAIYMGNKVPKGTGEIPQYAGDALAQPDQTSDSLIKIATNLNNSRNDIATGTTDPYGVGATSGIAYSPAELKAIESAYAGIYDPAISDAFARLRRQQGIDEAIIRKEERIFATNEAIRQWKATTGTKGNGSGSDKDRFTDANIRIGASKSGLGFDAFELLDDDVKNFFINTPKDTDTLSGKSYSMDVLFDNLISQVVSGEITASEATEEMTAMPTVPAVKTYYINQLDGLEPEEKEGWLAKAWNWLTN